MQSVDLAIAGVGALAIVATIMGVILYDDGSEDLTFATTHVAFEGAAVEVTDAGAMFMVPLVENATGIHLMVHANFEGQAIQGGDATIHAVITNPKTGAEIQSTAAAMTIAPGATEASGELMFETSWGEKPEDENGMRGDPEYTKEWLDDDGAPQELMIVVYIEAPGDMGGVLPIASYSFNASISGHLIAYEAHTEIADVEAV